MENDALKNALISEFFKYLGKVEYPLCEICDKRVDRLYSAAIYNALERSVSLYVECHGDKQLLVKSKQEAFKSLKSTLGGFWKAFGKEGFYRENGMLVPGIKLNIKTKKESVMPCKSKGKAKGKAKGKTKGK